MKTPQQPDPTEEIATGPLISFLSEIMDWIVAGRDQSAANQPNNLAEGHSYFFHFSLVMGSDFFTA